MTQHARIQRLSGAGYSEKYLIGYVLDELRQRAEYAYDEHNGRRR